jgi:hypothetical protein
MPTNPLITAMSVRGNEVTYQDVIHDEKNMEKFWRTKPTDKLWVLTVNLYFQTPEGLDGHELEVWGKSVVIDEHEIVFGGGVFKYLTIGRKPWLGRNDFQLIAKYHDSIHGEEKSFLLDPRIRLERLKEVVAHFVEDPTYSNTANPVNEEPLTEQEQIWMNTLDMYMDSHTKMYEELGYTQTQHEFPVEKDDPMTLRSTGLIEFLPRFAKNIPKTRRSARRQRKRRGLSRRRRSNA